MARKIDNKVKSNKSNTHQYCKTYEYVTETIVNDLENGVVPWRSQEIAEAWNPAYNRSSGKVYEWTNQILLGRSGEWATFNQWVELGFKVKKGAKSRKAVYFGKAPITEKDSETGEKKKVMIPVLRYHPEFHVSQVYPIGNPDGVVKPIKKPAKHPKSMKARLANLKDMVVKYSEATGIVLFELGDDAPHYDPATDTIIVPIGWDKTTDPKQVSEFIREIVRSTGGRNRLERLKPGVENGSFDFNKEELIDELGCSCIMSMNGIYDNSILDSDILKEWVGIMKSDIKFFVQASRAAEKAVKFFMTGKTDAQIKSEAEAESQQLNDIQTSTHLVQTQVVPNQMGNDPEEANLGQLEVVPLF